MTDATVIRGALVMGRQLWPAFDIFLGEHYRGEHGQDRVEATIRQHVHPRRATCHYNLLVSW